MCIYIQRVFKWLRVENVVQENLREASVVVLVAAEAPRNTKYI
jgi:hypothetical protein